MRKFFAVSMYMSMARMYDMCMVDAATFSKELSSVETL